MSEQGVATDPGKVDKVKSWPTPTTTGLANYYRDFAGIVKPLLKLTERNGTLKWTPECDDAITTLCFRLTTTPILVYPDFTKQFILDTDASNRAIRAKSGVMDRSMLLLMAADYCVTYHKLLAVIVFTKHFHPYLLEKQFLLYTDHMSLQWLCNFKDSEGQMARWLEAIQELDIKIVHRKGQAHNNADALSRIPRRQCGRLSDDLQ